MVYLDVHATTPVDPEVSREMEPWLFGARFGNADSPHAAGSDARDAVSMARTRVATLCGASPTDVLFTSGATESNNLALTAATTANGGRVPHVIAGATEHPSVLRPLEEAESSGVIQLDLLPVDSQGRPRLALLRSAIRPDTALLSFMAANNETGVLSPIEEIGDIARRRGILFHCDAAQAIGKVPINLNRAHADLLAISGHKVYGPMGIGALVASPRGRAAIRPLTFGGGQEQGKRSGTVNVPGAVGLGAACAVAEERMIDDAQSLSRLRDSFERALLEIDGVGINGSGAMRLPGSLSATIPGVPAETIFARCPELALSSGSACSSGSPRPSHVLTAMGLGTEAAEQTIRIGLPRGLSDQDAQFAQSRLTETITSVRSVIHA